MEQNGSNKYSEEIFALTVQIDFGRKALLTPKQTENGREAYTDGAKVCAELAAQCSNTTAQASSSVRIKATAV